MPLVSAIAHFQSIRKYNESARLRISFSFVLSASKYDCANKIPAISSAVSIVDNSQFHSRAPLGILRRVFSFQQQPLSGFGNDWALFKPEFLAINLPYHAGVVSSGVKQGGKARMTENAHLALSPVHARTARGGIIRLLLHQGDEARVAYRMSAALRVCEDNRV